MHADLSSPAATSPSAGPDTDRIRSCHLSARCMRQLRMFSGMLARSRRQHHCGVPTVVNALVVTLAPLMPLRVRTAEFTDPTLILTGEVWSLAVTCRGSGCAPTGARLIGQT